MGVGPWSVTVRKIGFGQSPKVWNRDLQRPESVPSLSNPLLEPHSLLEAYTWHKLVLALMTRTLSDVTYSEGTIASENALAADSYSQHHLPCLPFMTTLSGEWSEPLVATNALLPLRSQLHSQKPLPRHQPPQILATQCRTLPAEAPVIRGLLQYPLPRPSSQSADSAGWSRLALMYYMCALRQRAAGVRAPVSAASAVRHGTARS
jgi:hypothetical protein